MFIPNVAGAEALINIVVLGKKVSFDAHFYSKKVKTLPRPNGAK